MRFWTGHTRPGTAPVLVREGFSWGALIFGPFWLAAHRAWIAAALALAAGILIVALTAGATTIALWVALAFWLGLSGHDLQRWAMRHRGLTLFEIVAARNATDALARLLERRPGLAGNFLPPGSA